MRNKTKYMVMIVLALSVAVVVSADMAGNTGVEIQAIAESILDEILWGFENDDYEAYSANFDASLKETVCEQ